MACNYLMKVVTVQADFVQVLFTPIALHYLFEKYFNSVRFNVRTACAIALQSDIGSNRP